NSSREQELAGKTPVEVARIRRSRQVDDRHSECQQTSKPESATIRKPALAISSWTFWNTEKGLSRINWKTILKSVHPCSQAYRTQLDQDDGHCEVPHFDFCTYDQQTSVDTSKNQCLQVLSYKNPFEMILL